MTKDATPDNRGGYWIGEINKSIRAYDKWEKRCDEIRKRYRYDASSTRGRKRKYQMLWSNMETMKPAVMSKLPRAEVLRRFNDKDPTARTASEMLERCINVSLDTGDYQAKFIQVRDDFLLYARGTARVYYEPVFEAQEDDDGTDGLDAEAVEGDQKYITDEQAEAKSQPNEILTYEHVKIKYVQPGDFVHSQARTWDEVEWVAFRSYLGKDELVKRFGDKAKKIPIGTVMSENPNDKQIDMMVDKATIWEIWDKSDKSVKWVCEGYSDILEQAKPAYLQLEDFFPCPKPAYGTLTNDCLEPVPDFVYYQDQSEEIDLLTARIGSLTQSLKLVGFYPAGPDGVGSPEIERAVNPDVENKMIAVKSWAVFTEAGRGGAPVIWLPIEMISKILETSISLRQQLIEDVYQIYGLSDIMRGDGNAQETATAQNIKAQYGSVRIRDRQKELARFTRDICRLVGEIIVTHFQAETIMAMSNMPLVSVAQLQAQAQQAMMQQQQAMLMQQGAMMGGAMGMGGPPQGQPPMMQGA